MNDPYLSEWDAQAYLKQYYTTATIPDDSQALLTFISTQLARKANGYDAALEFGCGPTLYTALAMSPHVGSLHLAEYVPENREEICRWLNRELRAHDWSLYSRFILEMESGEPATTSQVLEREALLRRVVRGVLPCDLRQPSILAESLTFNLVVSCFCLECVANSVAEWESFLARLTEVVNPGGRLVMIALDRCQSYRIFDHVFPAVAVSEQDFRRVLPTLGFNAETLVAETVPIQDWAEEGFTSICCISAEKQR